MCKKASNVIMTQAVPLIDDCFIQGAIHKPCSHFLGDFGPPLPPNVDTFTPMT